MEARGAGAAAAGGAGAVSSRGLEELAAKVQQLEAANSSKDTLISELSIKLRDHERVGGMKGCIVAVGMWCEGLHCSGNQMV